MRFYIGNLNVEIKYSFLLIIAFTMLFKGYDYLYILLFSALHELGHLVMLYLLEKRADKLTFAYYGIGLKHSATLSALEELLFLSAGIVVNLFFTLADVKREINLALLVINALPVYPLDGGRILKLILNKVLNFRLSDKLFKFTSAVVITLLILLSIYIKSISLALISAYVIAYSLNYNID